MAVVQEGDDMASRAAWLVAVLFAMATLATTALWLGERARAERLEREVATLHARRPATVSPSSTAAVLSTPPAPAPAEPAAPAPAAPSGPVAPEPPAPPNQKVLKPVKPEPPRPQALVIGTPEEIAAYLGIPFDARDGKSYAALRHLLATDPLLRSRLLARLDEVQDDNLFRLLAPGVARLLGELALPAFQGIHAAHPSPRRRLQALNAIGDIQAPAALEFVLDVMRNASTEEGKTDAIYALGEPWGTPETVGKQVVETLRGVLDSRDVDMREQAAELLLEWAHRPEHAAILADYLTREQDPDVRRGILGELDEHALSRDPQVFAAIRRIFEDRTLDEKLRDEAATVLADTKILDDELAKEIQKFWEE